HRFFVPSPLAAGELASLPVETSRQISRVLRLRSGDRIVLFCGDGDECEAVLEEVGSGSASARVLSHRTPAVEMPCRLHVAGALVMGEKLDLSVQEHA